MRFLFVCGFLSSFLIPAASVASDKWVLAAKSLNGSEIFVYLDDVMEVGDLLYAKTLMNYSFRQDTGELSSVSEDIISCSREMIKTTRMATYSEKLAKGRKLSSDDLVKLELDMWQSPVSGSVYRDYVVRLCSHFGR